MSPLTSPLHLALGTVPIGSMRLQHKMVHTNTSWIVTPMTDFCIIGQFSYTVAALINQSVDIFNFAGTIMEWVTNAHAAVFVSSSVIRATQP